MLGEHSLARATAVLVLSKLGFGLRSSFFNGSSMVILVASQSSPARECLLAVGVRALVGSFTGMDATMSGQRGRIAEGLFGYRVSSSTQIKLNAGTHLSTSLTHVWLLSGMHTGVYR